MQPMSHETAPAVPIDAQTQARAPKSANEVRHESSPPYGQRAAELSRERR